MKLTPIIKPLLLSAVCFFLAIGGSSERNIFAPVVSPSGPLPWQLIAHTSVSSNTTGATTAAINCAAAGPNALLLINIGNVLAPDTPTTITDSSSNTYTSLANVTDSNSQNALYYSITSTVTSSMTATVTYAASAQPSFEFACFKSNNGAVLVDASNQNTATVSGTTLQTGTLTPFNANSLVIAGMGQWAGLASSVTFSIDSGFTVIDQQNQGTTIGSTSALAYLLQSSPAALNPTWTASAGSAGARTATIAAFTTTAIPQVTHVADSHAVITSSSTTLTFPGLTAPASGNAWVGSLIVETTSDLITSITAGSNTITKVSPTLCHSSSFFCYGIYGLSLTGGPTSIVVTLSGAPAGTFHDVIVSEYSGAVAFGTSSVNDTAGTSNNLTITPTSTHNLVWSGLHGSTSSVTFPAGFTTRLNDAADGDYSADFQQQNAQALGVAWTSSVASSQAVLTLVP